MAALLLGVLAAAILIGLRQALHSSRLRAAAEVRLSAMLGQPVTIGGIRMSVVPRLALTGSDIRTGAAADAVPGVHLQRIQIVPRLRSLISGDVVIEEVDLDGLIVAVLRDRAGRWHVPAAVPAPTTGAEGISIEHVRVTSGRVRVFDEIETGRVRDTANVDNVAADVTVEADGLLFSPISGRIGGAQIAGQARTDARAVRVEFTAKAIDDEDLPSLLRLLGSERPAFLRLPAAASASVALRINRATLRLSGTGSVRAPQVAIEPLRLQGFEAPFRIDGNRILFDPTVFALYSGAHTGSVAINLAEAPVSWSIDSRVGGLDSGDFLGALTGGDARVDGTAAVTASLHGRIGEPLDRTVRGDAHIVISDGVVRRFALLAFLNRALRLAEGDSRDTRFERLSATLALAAGHATTNDLVMTAGHVHVDAAGRIGFHGSLDLSGKAVFSAERSAEAIRSIRELSGLRNARGELELPLTITGTLDSPSFAVDVKAALGKSIKNELRRRLRGIIRTP